MVSFPTHYSDGGKLIPLPAQYKSLPEFDPSVFRPLGLVSTAHTHMGATLFGPSSSGSFESGFGEPPLINFGSETSHEASAFPAYNQPRSSSHFHLLDTPVDGLIQPALSEQGLLASETPTGKAAITSILEKDLSLFTLYNSPQQATFKTAALKDYLGKLPTLKAFHLVSAMEKSPDDLFSLYMDQPREGANQQASARNWTPDEQKAVYDFEVFRTDLETHAATSVGEPIRGAVEGRDALLKIMNPAQWAAYRSSFEYKTISELTSAEKLAQAKALPIAVKSRDNIPVLSGVKQHKALADFARNNEDKASLGAWAENKPDPAPADYVFLREIWSAAYGIDALQLNAAQQDIKFQGWLKEGALPAEELAGLERAEALSQRDWNSLDQNASMGIGLMSNAKHSILKATDADVKVLQKVSGWRAQTELDIVQARILPREDGSPPDVFAGDGYFATLPATLQVREAEELTVEGWKQLQSAREAPVGKYQFKFYMEQWHSKEKLALQTARTIYDEVKNKFRGRPPTVWIHGAIETSGLKEWTLNPTDFTGGVIPDYRQALPESAAPAYPQQQHVILPNNSDHLPGYTPRE
jgi:hypothetical protein